MVTPGHPHEPMVFIGVRFTVNSVIQPPREYGNPTAVANHFNYVRKICYINMVTSLIGSHLFAVLKVSLCLTTLSVIVKSRYS